MFVQIVKYGLVGGISTFIHIAIASLYIYFIDEHIFLANALGFCIAFSFSYTVQSLYVFEHKLNKSKFFKYFLVQMGALLLALFISSFLTLENLYVQTLIISILLPLITFGIHKLWTFKNIEDSNTYATK